MSKVSKLKNKNAKSILNRIAKKATSICKILKSKSNHLINKTKTTTSSAIEVTIPEKDSIKGYSDFRKYEESLNTASTKGSGGNNDVTNNNKVPFLNGVIGVRADVAAHLMGGGSSGGRAYLDEYGNIAVMENIAGTATTDVEVSLGAGLEYSGNNASVYDMEGKSITFLGMGGDTMVGLGANVESSYSVTDPNIIVGSYNVNVNASVSPAELHGGISNNDMILQYNVFTGKGEFTPRPQIFDIGVQFDLKNWKFKLFKDDDK